ncbi:MAG: polyprenyl synthetase family protein [Thermoplasmata archaeon]
MNFTELLSWVPRIERELGRAYAREHRLRPEFDPWTDTLEEFALRGGKRFRALLVLGGYWIATHRSPAPAVSAAAALEHFQSWMLIHDDLIDHALTRRGGPAVHQRLKAQHAQARWAGSSEEFGAGMAITLGDLEEPYTVQALLETKVPAARRLRAVAEYARMTRDTAYGQLRDIHNGVRDPGEVREEDVLEVHRLKTSVYTVAAPLRIGAILGGGRPALLKDLDSIGTDLGIAFQLRDDVIGAGFDPETSGKSANDLTEGKRTLLVVRAWAAAGPEGRQELTAALGRPEAGPEAVARALERIRTTGSLAYSERRIEELTARAYARIDRTATLRRADRALLREIGDRLVHRAT